jgi:hypothetical protein
MDFAVAIWGHAGFIGGSASERPTTTLMMHNNDVGPMMMRSDELRRRLPSWLFLHSVCAQDNLRR